MAASTYTVVGQTRIEADSEDDAKYIAFNSEVEWARHFPAKKKMGAGALLALGVMIPSPLYVVPKLVLAATA